MIAAAHKSTLVLRVILGDILLWQFCKLKLNKLLLQSVPCWDMFTEHLNILCYKLQDD